MRVLFDGVIHVEYAQIYLTTGDGSVPDLANAVGGQTNGLCGARVPGFLWLNVELEAGGAAVRVESHDRPPEVGEEWEEVVEVSFLPESERVRLQEWGGSVHPLALERRRYRVRYCGAGLDESHDVGRVGAEEIAPCRYLVQLWPDDRDAPDAVLRQTSASAGYWHEFARRTPPSSARPRVGTRETLVRDALTQRPPNGAPLD